MLFVASTLDFISDQLEPTEHLPFLISVNDYITV